MKVLGMNPGRNPAEAAELAPQDSRRLIALQGMYGIPAGGQTIADYWRVLQKRKWSIVISVIVVVTAAALISLRMTPIYDAAARISISQQTSNLLNSKEGETTSQSFGASQQDVETEIKIIQSETLAQIVIHSLNLDRRPEFAGGAQAKSSGGIAVSESMPQERSRQDVLIRRFLSGLKVQQVPSTSLIEIKYSSPDASLAAEIANATTRIFIEQNIKTRYDSTMQAADWLSKQLADLQIKVETSQAKLVEYEKEHGIVGADDKKNLTVDKLDELNKELTGAQADRIQKESLYQIVKSGHPDDVTAIFQDSVLASLRQQQTELESQDALLSTQFGPSYPKVLEIRNQLNEVKKAYEEELHNSVTRLENDYQTSLKREEMLQTALNQQTEVANQLSENAIQYKVLKQEADSNRQLYDGLLLKLKEGSLAAGLDSSNIRIVDVARVPLHPARPNIPLNLEFAVLIGLVGGIAIAFTLEGIDTTVRTPDQAENISGLPILGVIPLQSSIDIGGTRIAKVGLTKAAYRGGLRADPLISYLEPHSEVAEAYRALRTSILLSSVSHPPRTILVTSSVPQDGKTMTSVNTAIVLAQQGKRILLVDADLRRPGMHKVFSLGGKIGLSNILTGGAKLKEAIQTTVQPNLFVLPAGLVPPHPSELLSSSFMQELLKIWRDEYDHVIIDSPPVISVTDAVLLSVQVDAAILIIRSGQTTNALVRRSRDLLLSVNANILGVVVNAADLTSPDYYNYYYGSKYKYYASRKSSDRGKDNDSSGHDDQRDVAARTS